MDKEQYCDDDHVKREKDGHSITMKMLIYIG